MVLAPDPSSGTGPTLGEMPRVALFTDTFFEVNGAAHTLRKVADTFEATGMAMDVYCYAEQRAVIERGSVRIFAFDHRLSNNYYEKLRFELIPDLRIGAICRQRHRELGYTIVHLATPGSMGLAGRALANRKNLPMVGTYHTHLADYIALRSIAPLYQMMRRGSWKFMKWFYAPCQWVLGPTEGVVQELKHQGFENRLGVFTRGIDAHLYSTEKRTRSEERVVTSYVGRCAPEKNVRIIPQIVEGMDTDLWVIGDGPERPNLERELKRARFTGYLFGDELACAYADSDVLLFPSTTDTFGNVVLEAMASGVVPIVSAGPGPSDYVTHGDNAMICDGPTAMRDALKRLIKDRDLRVTMRRRARTFAEQRDWRRAVQGLIDVYSMSALR